jgi:hypothetical protein
LFAKLASPLPDIPATPFSLAAVPIGGPSSHQAATVDSMILQIQLLSGRTLTANNTIQARARFRTAAVLVMTRRATAFASSACKR